MLVLAVAASAEAAPTLEYRCTPAPADCTGWYRSVVNLAWKWDQFDASPSAGNCNPQTFRSDTKGTPVFCEVKDGAGFTTRHNVVIRIDRVAPAVTATPGRPPDYGGWFNHPVTVSFAGTDATSGVASCTTVTYAGPEGEGLTVPGSCTDVARNTGSAVFTLNYDPTPPGKPELEAIPGDRLVDLRWSLPLDAVEAEVIRLGRRPRVLYRGLGRRVVDRRRKNGVRERYRVVAIDRAGNRTPAQAGATPTSAPLLTPAAGQHLSNPPVLRWKRVKGASYYNVQLFRDGRKILTRWPRTNRFQLPESWRFAGRRRRLVPGDYRWYVWPGFGKRSEQRYGEVLGGHSFTVTG